MSVRDELLAEIAAVIAGGIDPIGESDLDDLYEAYVLSGVVQAAQADGWTHELRDVSNQTATSPLFRRSPGNIYRGKSGQPFTHFILHHLGVDPLEVHLGIMVTGKSDIQHECDVAVLPHDHAEFCRTHRVHPKSAKLVLAAECKFLAGNVPLGLGRGFIGLITELTSTYGQHHFVVNTSSAHVMKMLARQKRQPHDEVTPGTGRFDSFVSACQGIFRQHRRRTS